MSKKRLLACLLALCVLTASSTSLSAVRGEEETPAASETAAPVETPAPTPEPAAEPSAKPTEEPEPTAEPVAEPTPEPALDPTAEPTPELTLEPTVQPEETPSAALPPESVIEPTAGPTQTPAEEPAAEALAVRVRTDRNYAFANEETVRIDVTVGGGVAPYSVSMQTAGASSESSAETLQAAGGCSFSVMPGKFGILSVMVVVTDAAGQTASAGCEIAVPVNERETKSHWERSMADVELTGNWREDLLNIAASQLGYRESTRNFILDSKGVKHGYTRYGDWYGAEYYEWCAIFVAFCLDYAEISEDDFPRDNKSAYWQTLMRYREAYEAAESGYEPRPGDLIFIRREEDSERPEHIGIVEKVIDGTIHTIEGNSGGRVSREEYALDDVMIVGYANTGTLMKRAGVDDPEPVDVTQTVIPAGGLVGYTLGSYVNVRSEASRQGDIVVQIAAEGAEVRVIGYEVTQDGLWLYITCEDFAGYVLADLIELVRPEETPQSACAD